MKKIWEQAWNLGAELAKCYDSEEAALYGMDLDDLEAFETVTGYEAFFHAGFIGREPEWVEAVRYGEIPEAGYSINWADGTKEPGVSVVKIIRKAEDAEAASLYSLTLADRDLVRVAGWWLGLTGSDGEATLLGCVRV